MNDQNLKKPTAKEARELGRNGGIKSGIARRRKRDRREWAKIIGALPADVVTPKGSSLDDADLDAAVVMALYRKAAIEGNPAAAKLVLELNGDLETGTTVNVPAPIVVRSAEEGEAVAAAIAERARRSNAKGGEGE